MIEKDSSSGEKVIPNSTLESRISRLGYIETNAEYLTAISIANKIGTYENWVKRKIEEFRIVPDDITQDGRGRDIKSYSAIVVEVLADERSWYDMYDELPDMIGHHRIAEVIGRSYGWTRKTLGEIEAKASLSDNERKTALYHKSYAKKLREIDLSTPMDNGWLTLRALSEATKQDREWTERKLQKAGIDGELRRAAESGRVFTHYPPESLNIILEAVSSRSAYGGDWLTSYKIASLVGKSENWINRALLEFANLSKTLQDDNGVDREHYPPEVLQEIQNIP